MKTDETNPQPMTPAATNQPLTNMPDMAALLRTAREAALAAGKVILDVYLSDDYGAEEKADKSPLTKADKAAHAIIAGYLHPVGLPVLSEEGADIPFEERSQWVWYWLVDPLDGTKEFLKRNGEFTVNIALLHLNVPVGGVVYAPCTGALYYGSYQTGVTKETNGATTQLMPLPAPHSFSAIRQKPQAAVVASRTHLSPETSSFIDQFRNPQLQAMGSSLKFMLLAEGLADIYPRFAPTMEWDTAAAHALLKALNRNIYQQDLQTELAYNKPNLLNPSFVAF